MNSICEIVRFNILGWVTTSWTYSSIFSFATQPRNAYLEIDEEDDNAKVDEGVGRGDEVRLLVHHEYQGSQQAGLRRAAKKKIIVLVFKNNY